MKKILFIALCAFLFACNKNDENDLTYNRNTDSKELLTRSLDYDQTVKNLAVAVSEAMISSIEFRNLIKSDALKQFDGDYDVLLSNMVAIQIPSDENGVTRSYDFTVGDLLSKFYPDKELTRSSGVSIFELIQNQYPAMQISIPIHAEEWNTESYIPVVCYLPSDFEDLKTKYVMGVDANGNSIEVDAINHPSMPVVVVSLSERFDALQAGSRSGGPVIPSWGGGGGGGGLQPKPIISPVVKGEYQGGAIRLSWSSYAAASDIMELRLYRSGPNNSTTFTKIASFSKSTTAYVDWNVVSNKEYVYKLVLCGIGKEISSSQPYYITTNNNIPQKVLNLNAQAIGKKRIELKWDNPAGERYNTRIERIVGFNNNSYETIATLGPNEDIYLDTDIVPGEKVTYIVRKVDFQNRISDRVQTYTYATFRNPDGISKVYLKQMICNLREVESWIAGKPEFYVKVGGVQIDKTTNKRDVIELGPGADVKFASASGTSQILNNALLHNWSYFNHSDYYPTLTFSLMEYDVPSSQVTLDIGVSAGVKLVEGVELKVEGKVSMVFPHSDKHCGESSILYFENPEQWIDFPRYGCRILISERP